jgi:hypothetical protein
LSYSWSQEGASTPDVCSAHTLSCHIDASYMHTGCAATAAYTAIRTNKGHSAMVDLQLEEVARPQVLYHGTGERSVETTLASGPLR